MDFTQQLARAILDGGKPAYREFLQRGVPDELIQGIGKPAIEYIRQHASQYGALPDIAVIEGKLGIPMPANLAGCNVTFWLDEIVKNAIGNEVKKSIDGSLEHLKNSEIIESFEALQAAVQRVQRMQLGDGDTRVTSMFEEGANVWDYYKRTKSGERGILTPWEALNDSTLGFGEQELILFAARSGLGKCVHESTEISDPETGIVRTIREVVEGTQSRVWTWSKENGIHSAPITAKVDTGTKQCIRVTFASGRSLTATPEHPLLTAEGWARLDAFKVGMTAALPACLPGPERSVALPSETVFVLALLLAEGSYTGNHVGFSTADLEILQRARQAADAIGGVEVKHRSNYDYDFVATGYLNPIRTLLKSHGIDDTLAKLKVLPDAIYRLPTAALSDFLSTFWMCDGYVDASGPGITLASKELVHQLQHLLLRFGIQSSVDYKQATCDGKKFDSWRLRVYSLSLENFSRAIHLWGHKEEKLSALLTKARNTNVGYPRVSDAFVERLKVLAATRSGRQNGSGLLEVARKLGRDPSHEPGHGSYFGVRDMVGNHNSLWLRPFKAFCEVYEVSSEYEWLWGSDIFWDVVEKIENVGEQKIYDLTVAPTSCFVANDIIVHNTWASLMIAEHAWTGYEVQVKPYLEDGTWGSPVPQKRKHKVLYVTTEMSKLLIALRFFALQLKLPYGRLRSGQLTKFEEDKLQGKTTDQLKETGMGLVGGNFDFRAETLAAAIDEFEPELVVIDGIYLIKVPGKDRIEQAANAFNEVKRLATAKKLPIVVTSQFNREVKKNQAGTVQAESVALTDAAVWNSTGIFGMVQTDDMRKDKRMLIKQLKVRDGAGNDIELVWDFETMDFKEVPKGPGSGFKDAVDVGGGGGSGGVGGEVASDTIPF